MTETTILDEGAVSEIEAAQVKRRESLAFHQSEYPGLPSPSYIEEIDSLCATVKHLRAENERLLQLYNSAWLWVQQRVKHPNTGQPPAAMTLMEMLPLLNQRAIQLCKDKAAKYEALIVDSLPNDQTAARTATAARTLRNLATDLENL